MHCIVNFTFRTTIWPILRRRTHQHNFRFMTAEAERRTNKNKITEKKNICKRINPFMICCGLCVCVRYGNDVPRSIWMIFSVEFCERVFAIPACHVM